MGLIASWIAIVVWQMGMPAEALAEFQGTFGLTPIAVSERFAAVDQVTSVVQLGDWLLAAIVPFLTYSFLHGGIVHLVGNTLFFWVFGSRLEARAGSVRFALFFVLAGIAAGCAQVVLASDRAVPTVGASGAVAGCMAAYLCIHPKARVLLLVPVVVIPVFVEIAAPLLILFWGALQFPKVQRLLAFGPGQPIAWHAHLGGLAAGIVLALLLWPRRKRSNKRSARPKMREATS